MLGTILLILIAVVIGYKIGRHKEWEKNYWKDAEDENGKPRKHDDYFLLKMTKKEREVLGIAYVLGNEEDISKAKKALKESCLNAVGILADAHTNNFKTGN